MIDLKKLKFLFFFIILTSCLIDEDEDVIRDGFELSFFNRTNTTYTGKLLIGGFKDNIFIATDSINFEREIAIGTETVPNQFTDANRWKPDLDKIRNLPSANSYFKIKLSDGTNQLLTRFDTNELFNLKLPNTDHYRGNFGYISITIDDNQISAHAIQEE